MSWNPLNLCIKCASNCASKNAESYLKKVLKVRWNYLRVALKMRWNFKVSAHSQSLSKFQCFQPIAYIISADSVRSLQQNAPKGRWYLDPGYEIYIDHYFMFIKTCHNNKEASCILRVQRKLSAANGTQLFMLYPIRPSPPNRSCRTSHPERT